MCHACILFPCVMLCFMLLFVEDGRSDHIQLHSPPPHISSSEEILPCLTCRTLVQLRINKSPFLKSYLHKSKSSPLCPYCNTDIISSTAPTYAPHCHPWISGQTRQSDGTTGQRIWLVDYKRKIGLPP